MVLHVTQVTTPEQLAIAQAIRVKVFIEEQGFAREIELDGKDELPTTRHFIGKDTEQDQYVAAARALITPELRKAKIGRVGILHECRGKKFGAAIMQAMEKALAKECDTFVLSSQYDKRHFYEKCGYSYLNDEVYLEEGVQHCMMIKSIASE